MDTIKQKLSKSVMSVITLSLISIIAVALLSIFISFWLTELAGQDAQAIKTSDTMRLQTYRIGLALHRGDKEQATESIQALDQTWNHSLFAPQRLTNKTDAISQKYQQALKHWQQVLKPNLLINLQGQPEAFNTQLLDTQILLTDQLVQQFRQHADKKILQLRSFQLLALLITTLVGSLIFFLLRNRIEKPLDELSRTAQYLGRGDYSQRVDISGEDELGLLGGVFNQMSESIESAYAELERRVEERTAELHQNNIALEFLFNNARRIIDHETQGLDHQQVVDELAEVLGVETIELCLFTEQGEKPYTHVAPNVETITDCSNRSCEGCKAHAPFSRVDVVQLNQRYPIARENQQYGVISLNFPADRLLESWQEKLLHSAADQLAISLSLDAQKDQQRRLALHTERTVIARELHDSLAQALSYLQIQVTRLQKSRDKEKWELQQPIIDELREGLSSAYRQLRELLTTFRLKMDSGGLRGALNNTVKQLRQRCDMDIWLNYQLDNLPLSPTEEIHLLQIVREASQNALHHSKGTRIDIELYQSNNNEVVLSIRDNGVGIGSSPEKLNHYGLAIMNERSRHLGGQVNIATRAEGGTTVDFSFVPEILRQKQDLMHA